MSGLAGQEAQIVDLFADLCRQRKDHGRAETEERDIEAMVDRAEETGIAGPVAHRFKPLGCDEDEGGKLQHHPERLRPCLEPADEGHPVGDEGDDGDRADDVADRQRQSRDQFQRLGDDRRLDGEEEEGEAGIDQ